MRTTILTAALASLLVLAACGDADDPVVAGDSTADTTETTAPPVTETTAPPVTETTAPPVTETTAPPTTTGDTLPPAESPGGGASSESGEELEADLAAARERWAATGLTSYTMEFGVVCFCPVEYRGPFLVTVEDGMIVSVAYAEGVEAIGEVRSDVELLTIEQIFDEIESWIGEADEVRVTYDEETGVPTDVWIDPSFQMADEERGYTVALVDRA